MPSRGLALAVAVTNTAVSPQRTMQEPPACCAYLPVSMVSFLPATSVVNILSSIFRFLLLLGIRARYKKIERVTPALISGLVAQTQFSN